jgi:hypothetical protein
MKYRKSTLALTALGYLLALAQPMFAGNPSFDSITNPAPITYSPDIEMNAGGSIRVKNNNWDKAFCVAFTAVTLAGGVIGYDLKKPYPIPSFLLSKTGTATNTDQVLSGAFVPDDRNSTKKTLTYAIVTNPGYLPVPGTYTVNMTVKLYASSLPTTTAVAIRTASFSIVVNNSFDVAVVAVDAPFSISSTTANLSFGIFAEGDSKSIDVIVRSNVIHNLALSSAKGWKLANTDPLDTSTAAYSITSNNTPLSLTAGSAAPITSGGAATAVSGKVYRLAFTLLPFIELPTEGSYADTLTLVVSAP